jgi:phosphonate transport system substrate-binding protein
VHALRAAACDRVPDTRHFEPEDSTMTRRTDLMPAGPAPTAARAHGTTAFGQGRRAALHTAAAGLLAAGLGTSPALSSAQTPAGHAGPLTLGVLPNVSARILLATYQPMREYLEAVLSRPVEVVTAADFPTFSRRTLAGDYDLVVIAPNLGRVAQIDAGWQPLAIYEPGIPAVMIALRSNPNDDPAQLRGKSLAMANPQSLVALVGLDWLRDQGLRNGQDFRTVLAANDDSLGVLLRSGDAPWAVMSMGEFNAKSPAMRESLRIVSVVARLPGFLVMGHPRLTPALRDRLQSLVLAFPPTEPGQRFLGLSGFTGIRPVAAADLQFLDPYLDVTRRGLGLTAGPSPTASPPPTPSR